MLNFPPEFQLDDLFVSIVILLVILPLKCPLKSRTVQHNKPHVQASNACFDSPSPFLSNINYSIASDMNEEPTISTISTAEIDTNPCSVFGPIYSVPFNFF